MQEWVDSEVGAFRNAFLRIAVSRSSAKVPRTACGPDQPGCWLHARFTRSPARMICEALRIADVGLVARGELAPEYGTAQAI